MSRKTVQVTKKNTSNPKTDDTSETTVLDRDEYLLEIISIDPHDSKRYICELCTENQQKEEDKKKRQSKGSSKKPENSETNGDKEKKKVGGLIKWLKRHLEGPTHEKFTKKENMPKLKRAIKSLCGKRAAGNAQESEESPDEDQEIIINSQSEDDADFLPLSKEAEANLYLDIGQFIVDKHLPFEAADGILQFLKTMTARYDCHLIEKAHTSSTTMTKIIRECIGKTYQEKILKDLEKYYFSILLDESTEVYGGKYLAILARYVDIDGERLVTKLVSVLELDSVCSGEALFNKVMNEFLTCGENLKNMIVGSCTDNASTMISSRGKGFFNRLSQQAPNAIHMRDLCHSLNLIIEDSLKIFPLYIIDFIKKICKHFNAGQRGIKLKEIQAKDGVKEPLVIMSYSGSRWSSLVQCIERILKLWRYLKTYFNEEKGDDSKLREEIDDPEYELYTYLLFIFLHKIDGYIILFQKDDLLWDSVLDKIREAYTIFGRMLVKEEFKDSEFDDVFQIPLHEENNKLSNLDEFKNHFVSKYTRVKEFLEKVKQLKPRRTGIEKEFFTNAREVIISLLNSMKARLPYENELLISCQTIFLKERYPMELWRSLASKFPNVINDEKKEIKFTEETDVWSLKYKTIISEYSKSKDSIITRWKKLSSDYPMMASLAFALLALPYSSSPVESTFSEFKAFKTCYRNRLNVENLEASILAEQEFNLKPPKVSSQMVDKYFEMWKQKSPLEMIIEEPPINKDPPNPPSPQINDTNPLQTSFLIWVQPIFNTMYEQWRSQVENSQKTEAHFLTETKTTMEILYAQWKHQQESIEKTADKSAPATSSNTRNEHKRSANQDIENPDLKKNKL